MPDTTADAPVTTDAALFFSDSEVGTLIDLRAFQLAEEAGKPYSWYPMIPFGKWRHGQDFVEITPEDGKEFADNFRARVRGIDIAVQELEGHEQTDGGRALGWFEDVDLRPDAVWCKVGWTKLGQEELAADNFRYMSPDLHLRKNPYVNHNGVAVPNVVTGAALTNKPVFKNQPRLEINMSEYAREQEQGATLMSDAPMMDDASEPQYSTNFEATLAVMQSADDAGENADAEIWEALCPLRQALIETLEEIAEADSGTVDKKTLTRAALAAFSQAAYAALTEGEPAEAPIIAAEPVVLPTEEGGTIPMSEPLPTAEPNAEALQMAEDLKAAKEALRLAEAKLAEQAEKDTLRCAEGVFTTMKFAETDEVLPPAARELARDIYLGLPEPLQVRFAEGVQDRVFAPVLLGEHAGGLTAPPPAKKVSDEVAASIPESSRAAVLEFAEKSGLEDADTLTLWAEWNKAGKPAATKTTE
jgi:hypothetical protein